MWRKVGIEESQLKNEKRERGEREKGLWLMRSIKWWGLKEGRRRRREEARGFVWALLMAVETAASKGSATAAGGGGECHVE